MIIINLIFNFMLNNFTETELTNERWKDIDGYDGMYQVSDLGRVRSKHSGEWKVMRFSRNKSGYLSVNLSNNKEIKHFYVHRLVASAFITNNDDAKNEINHRNEIKSDNRVSNLEYCDRSYNLTYNDLQFRKKNSKRRKIEKLYDKNLSINENLELFKSNGIECSNCTVARLRKDLNLDRCYHQPKRNKVKYLYDPNLTYAQNLEIFRANGVPCSTSTLQKLRNDLGLLKKHNVCNEVKDLYDPNLTYQENLKVFKQNGVECSEKTIQKLRKDLGLTGYRTKYKQNKVRELYNPALSYKENLEIFKENGVECSEYIVTQLRKELNLSQPKPKDKRSKIKSLYNPELSIKENIKVFKENGISCSRNTVSRLRRDLGLIK